jgi:hypothetical protein
LGEFGNKIQAYVLPWLFVAGGSFMVIKGLAGSS